MLTFVGSGLYDERSITIEGRDALRDADRVFAECYTSKLAGATIEDLESAHDIEIEIRDRAGVEQHPEPILDAAETSRRSEEHTSELQSRFDLVCRLLLEKKKE